MPTNHEAVVALPVGAGTQASKTLIRNMSVRRMAYVLADTETAQDLIAIDPSTGATIVDLVFRGRLFHLDAADLVTAHDGTTCLVSSDGLRYKLANGTDVFAYSVLSNTVSTPPVSPAIGDAYLIPTSTGVSGAWAGHEGEIAVYTARGWEFVDFSIGRFIYVESTNSYYHKNSVGDWTIGFGSQSLSANTVAVSSIIGRPVRWHIENQTTNTPPAASLGLAYIVGPSPTGAWAGQATKVAISEDGSTWTFYTQRTGELAYDKALSSDVRWNGTLWIASGDGLVLLRTQVASASATIDFTTNLDDTYDAYQIRFSSVKPATDDVSLLINVGTGGGPTYQNANYRYSMVIATETALDILGSAGSGIANILLNNSSSGEGVGNAAGRAISGVIEFDNPEAGDFFSLRSRVGYRSSGGNSRSVTGNAFYGVAGAVTAIRFKFSVGNIAAGRFSLYGQRKS